MTDQDEAVPVGWGQAPLGHLCLINPRSFVEAVDDGDDVSFVPMAAVEADTGNLDSSLSRPYKEVKKGYTRFSEGDVLFAKITPCMENGKIAVAKGLKNGAGCGSTEFHVMRPIEGLNDRLLMFFLLQEAIRREAQGNMSGSAGQLRVPAAFLEAATFLLPPLAEQHRIVAEIEKQLTRLDAAVAALRRARANLKRYRASVLKDACEGRLVPTEASVARAEGREYEHAGQLLQRILEERRARWESQEKRRGAYKEPAAPDTSALPELPEGWVWATLPAIGQLDRGKSRHRPRNDPSLFGGAYPFVQTGDVRQSGELIDSHSQTYNEKGLRQSRLWPAGTLCITIAANIADTGILSYPACFPDSVVGFSSVCNATQTKFVDYYLRTKQSELESLAPATAQKNINLKVLSEIPFPIPPLAEQHRIVPEVERRLSLVQKAEATLDASLRRAERLRQSVLKRAFEGKLVPQDPNDEPASVLLERIRAERDAAEASESRRGVGRRGRRGASQVKERA